MVSEKRRKAGKVRDQYLVSLTRIVLSLVLCLPACHQRAPKRRSAHAHALDAATADAGINVFDAYFFGISDEAVRQKLAGAKIVDVERGSGGRSVGFKVVFEDGSKAYFKPEQTFSAAHWYGEIAAYHVDRMLGLGRAIPSIGRVLPWAIFKRHTYENDRQEVIIQKDETVRGVIVAWVEEKLIPLRPGGRWERWLRVNGALPNDWNTPFQRPIGYTTALYKDSGIEEDEDDEPAQPMREPDTDDRVQELSDLILFDYLIMNQDRWGGGYTNVRTRGEHGPLIYLDNAAGFSPNLLSNGLMLARLHSVQKFNRSTVDAIAQFDIQRFRAELAKDPLAPVLDDSAYALLDTRRSHVLEHVEKMQAKYGERIFFQGAQKSRAPHVN